MTELSKKQTEQRASLGFQGDWHSLHPDTIRYGLTRSTALSNLCQSSSHPSCKPVVRQPSMLSLQLACVQKRRCKLTMLHPQPFFAHFWTASISGSWFHLIWRVVGLFNNFWHADKLLEVLVDIWASGGSLELVLPILVEGIKEHSMPSCHIAWVCKMQRFVCRDQHSDLFSHFIPWWCLIHLMTQGRPLPCWPCCRFSRCQNCSSHPYSMVAGDPLVDAQLLLSEATEPT